MAFRKYLSVLIGISVLINTNIYSSVNASSVSNSKVFDEKISAELREQMNNSSSKCIPVVLWYDSIQEEEIEDRIETEIGFNRSSIEEKYSSPSVQLIDMLSAAANGDTDVYLKSLMHNHLELTETSRLIEKEKTELYSKTRKQLVKSELEKKSKELINNSCLSSDNVSFVSSYAPMIIASLSSNEISEIKKMEEIREISLYVPLDVKECIPNFGTTKTTVGINQINEQIGLTGEGVNIGIYEKGSFNSAYYDTNGLTSSDVTIIGAEYNSGDHSTYCAGIAAGSAGIAPDAHLYSASSYIDNDFSWSNYDNAQLSNLEALIDANADIISMSWIWINSQNDAEYDNYAKYIDFLISNTNTTIVCASGNDSSKYLSEPATAYNAITVNGFIDEYNGNVSNILNDYTYKNGNHCLKPDVVAPSLNNGTSTSTPYIAGMIALMYQYKPSLKVMPETTKAILLGSCHDKCTKLLTDSGISNLSESMLSGITNRQGAGIPNMYRMISMVSQHTYGNGILNSSNSFQRELHFLQPKYNSNYINISMAYLQTNVPTNSTTGVIDDYDIYINNNNSTYSSLNHPSSTEMIYRSLTNKPNYTLEIKKYSGESESVRYAYAWSTDNESFYNNYDNEGVFYLKNYKSSYYLSRNTSNNRAYQTSFSDSSNSLWVIDEIGMNGTYAIKSADIQSNGLGSGTTIGTNNYYAIEGTNASTSEITIQFNSDTGTYTFKRNINGTIYALGINGNSISTNSLANWYPYSANNKSQKWYLETANYRRGDADINGFINSDDASTIQDYCLSLLELNNLQSYTSDANADGLINLADAIKILQTLL